MTLFSSTGHAAPITTLKFQPIRIKSLFRRDLLLTTLWSAVAILVIGFFISDIYRKSVERNFHDLLRAELYNVIDSVTISDGVYW